MTSVVDRQLQSVTLGELAAATAVTYLLNRISGALLGWGTWPLMQWVHRNANPVLGVVGLVINVAALFITILLLRAASAAGTPAEATMRLPRLRFLFAKNANLLKLAQTIALIWVIWLCCEFLVAELTALVRVNLSNLLQLDLSYISWLFITDVVIPGVLIVLLLVARRSRGGTNGA